MKCSGWEQEKNHTLTQPAQPTARPFKGLDAVSNAANGKNDSRYHKAAEDCCTHTSQTSAMEMAGAV